VAHAVSRYTPPVGSVLGDFMDLSGFSVPLLSAVFLIAALVITVFGSLMTRTADRLADATGLGEALMGALFLGGSTSMPGIMTSVTAAYQGYPELAASNAVGGIAAQTAFLAVADMTYRKANLEHAAASIANMMQGTLLVGLLGLSIIGISGPQMTLFQVHPVSFLLIAGYGFGLLQISKARTEPMWRAEKTRETSIDVTRTERLTTFRLALTWMRFAGYGLVIGVAGYVVAESGIALSNQAGISQTVVGGFLTAIVTSLPELVTSIAAVRQGALTLAVGGVIGGNCFDVLFLSFSDFAYREGSIYDALGREQIFMISLTILLTGILLLGLLRREKHGIANIGFESFFIIVFYVVMFVSIHAF
jgi:cation:H+ antiporter